MRYTPENPHYFLWQGRPTILVTSGEHYGALLNGDFDYAAYFDELKSHGLNHTRTFSGVYREDAAAFHITDNPLAPTAEAFVCPWARSDQPGGRDGGNKFDLTKWNDAYFRRLHDFMVQAKQRDIVVELTLFCPLYNDALWSISPLNAANNINGVGTCPRTEVYTLQHAPIARNATGFDRKDWCVSCKPYDNLYFEVCNEPYFGGVTDAWQRKIVDADRGCGTRLQTSTLDFAQHRQRAETN